MAIIPTLATIGALAPPAGRLAAATQLFGADQREALAELEQPGLRRQTEESLGGFRQDMLRPLFQARSEEQQQLAQTLTPAAAGGALGATAKAFQGAEQRMERATEGPMLKIAEERRKAEIKEEEDEAKLQAMKRERRQAVLRETFAVLEAGARGAEAFEKYGAFKKFWADEQGRMKQALGVDGDEEITPEDQKAAADRAGLGDRYTDATVKWADAIGQGRIPSPAAAMREQDRAQVEMALAMQELDGAAEPGFEFDVDESAARWGGIGDPRVGR